ncbi:MAG: 50S ribosomal protein L15 [bacterium]|jgi:large subunit ribosomal protein L15|nr:50S ribosomal protein L15 [bacterium]
MALTLHTIHPKKGSTKSKKRVGRGLASKGTFSGRGVKGQKSRSGASGFQKRGIRQIMLATPKLRGFKSGREKAQVVNVADLAKTFKAGAKVSPATLMQKGLIDSAKKPVKVLGNGAIGIAITLTECKISETAKQKIQEAGGTVV